jgi:hypothetical protein
MASIHALHRSSRTADPEAEPPSVLLPGVDVALAEHAEQAVGRPQRHARLQQVDGALIHALGIPARTLAIGAGSTAPANSAGWITAPVACSSAAFTTAAPRAR